MFDPDLGAPVVEDIMQELGASRYDVLQLLHECEAVPYYQDGKVVAAAARLGTEIHFAVDAAVRRRLITRKRAREFLQPLLENFGFLTTRLLLDRAGQQKFIERIGFKKTWSDGKYNYFMLTDLPFERKQHAF